MTTWHVNVGVINAKLAREYDGNRSWEDCRKYGMVSAGQAPKYSKWLQPLAVGDHIYAYLSGHGYVGTGYVTETAKMARDVVLPEGSLLSLPLSGTLMRKHVDDPKHCEYVVRVNWVVTLDADKAVYDRESLGNISPLGAHRIVDEAKLAYLKHQFDASTYVAEPGLPPRAISISERVIRNTAIIDQVKTIHRYQCQICGQTIRLRHGFYAEGHHIRPLGREHAGPDVIENILCVCPNHHVALDYGAIELNLLKLRTHPAHQVGPEYIDYHNNVICRGENR